LLAQQQALVQAAQRQPLTASFPALAAAELIPAPPEPTASTSGNTPPHNAAEAEQRFYTRYGRVINGSTWNDVQRYLGHDAPQPTTVEEWISMAEAVRERNQPTRSPTGSQRVPARRLAGR